MAAGSAFRLALVVVLGLVGIAGDRSIVAATAAAAAEPVRLAPPVPAEPQPDPASLTPGLAVAYWFDRFEHIRDLERYSSEWEGEAGQALPNLDYQSAGNALNTTASSYVGARITGLIRMEAPGPYTFVVTSNDGVRVTLGGVVIHEDPDVHGDADSPPLRLEIAEPGWYPLDILYFQKKGSSALKLWWQPPGAATRSIVPATAFGHPGR